MTVRDDSWGKSGIRLVHLTRSGDWFELQDLEIETTLVGETSDVYELGSNAKILSTDAQRNAVYAFAAEHAPDVPEEFASRLAAYFVESQEPVSGATVAIEQRDWRRIDIDGTPAPHSFQGGGQELRIAVARIDGQSHTISGGIARLPLLNATGSEFLGFPRDRYTTGHGAVDRILATSLDASWLYTATAADFNAIYGSVCALLRSTFATVYSKSIQFSMRAMATAVLDAHPEIEAITLTFPNLHHHLVDLSPFGLENNGAVFSTAPAPHSLIKATFTR